MSILTHRDQHGMMYVHRWCRRQCGHDGNESGEMMVVERNDGRAALSVRQACAILGVGRATLYDLIESGRLPAFRPGKRAYRIPGEALTAFQEAEIRKVHAAHQRPEVEATR